VRASSTASNADEDASIELQSIERPLCRTACTWAGIGLSGAEPHFLLQDFAVRGCKTLQIMIHIGGQEARQ